MISFGANEVRKQIVAHPSHQDVPEYSRVRIRAEIFQFLQKRARSKGP
jgi:hypothetical protein